MADETWAAAWAALRSGRPGEAERLARAGLAAGPAGHPRDGSAEGCFLLGAACHNQGRSAEAEDCFRRTLELRPDAPDAHNALGLALLHQGRIVEAEKCFRQALALRPDLPEGHNNLGSALEQLGRKDEAVASYRRAVELRSDYINALNNLGNALRDLGRLGEAEASYVRALELRPDFPDVLNNLGNTLQDQGRSREAVEYFSRALCLRPDLPEALNGLGNALRDLGRPSEAAECYTRALRVRPDLPEALNGFGNTLYDLGHVDRAEVCYRDALRFRPSFAEVHYNLGNVLRAQNRLGEAEECLRRALALRPTYPDALLNLGTALKDQGRIDEAIECFRQALKLRPSYAAAHSALLLTLNYWAGVKPAVLANEHAEYQRRHAAPLRTCWRPHANDRDPDRPLRLGFVSADFGHHPVGYLLVRAVEALARRPGVVVCYSDRRTPPDDITARFRATSQWREVAKLDDEGLAGQVRADGIDVLIDLAGHTAGNRLLAFARKPAPVQCTWLGYPGTTGLEAIDFLIADGHQVPPGAEAHYRERVLRLPGGYASYDPPADVPEPGPLPALTGGHVTFGSFNNPAKLSNPALALWAVILRRVPCSRLRLKYGGMDDPTTGARVRTALAAVGVEPDRVELLGGSGRAEHLAAYRDIDVALDPFPYGGGVTTIDALWMGVPVVTWPQDTFASRHALSHLASVGFASELAVNDADDYVARASDLAFGLGRLSTLRAELRGGVARSPLCEGERLADELLAALRAAWREWVAHGTSDDR